MIHLLCFLNVACKVLYNLCLLGWVKQFFSEVTTAVPMAIHQNLFKIHTRKRGEQDAYRGGQILARGYGKQNYFKSVF